MTNNIDTAINQATQAAANFPRDEPTLFLPEGRTSGKPISLDEAMTGTLIVDDWLKVSEHGLQIGARKPLLEEILVRIDMSEVSFCNTVKYGNPATYRKSYDREMATDGTTWAQALAEARRVDPKARPYKSADINIELVDDVTLKDAVMEAGTVLGHSFSTTGFRSFAKLVKQMTKDGADPASDTIEVTIGYCEQNGNGNSWGVLEFRDYKVVG